MKWNDVARQTCSIARSLGEIGERWTLLLVRDAMLGARTFSDFAEGTGAARNILTTRLEQLVEAGIFRKREYQRNPVRHEYILTPKGIDLFPVLMAIVKWGNKWQDDGLGVPIEHTHTTCGHTFETIAACSACGEEVLPSETALRAGPSFRDEDPYPAAWRYVRRGEP